MEKRRIAIFGLAGKEGRWFEAFFVAQGQEVRGIDPRLFDSPSIEELLAWAEVIFVAVPPREVENVLRALRPHLRPEHIVLDVTSVKAPVFAGMQLHTGASFVSIHPMCAPPKALSLNGQVMVVCSVQLNPQWQTWLDEFLAATGATLLWRKVDEHDQRTSIVQGLTHAVAHVMAATIRQLNIDFDEVMRFASPVFRIALSWIGRILKQDIDLRQDIQFLNPWVLRVLEVFEQEARRFRSIIQDRDSTAFASESRASVTHIGPEQLQAAFDLFADLNDVMVDRMAEHQLVFEIDARDDHAGAFVPIVQAFAKAGISLESTHSFRRPEGRRFLVTFDRPLDDPDVVRACQSSLSAAVRLVAK